MASTKTIEIVKSTVPVLKEHGEAITRAFYKRLFKKHPELRNIFNMTHQTQGSQPKVLANAIFQYATYIDQLEMLSGAVNAIAHKHSSLSITPEMYPIVGENLLEAIKEVLGAAATPEIIDAWAEAYSDLAKIFIRAEEAIYQKNENKNGGFRGKKTFKVVDKVVESEIITSFYLQPMDGSCLPEYLPGQYIALTVAIPGHDHLHTRNYSLSDYGNFDSLRISVKKEPGNPEGIVSNYLHEEIHVGDTINIGMPSGEFVLKQSESPVVLIAGGVGITPLISMLKALSETQRKVVLIQCAINSSTQAFSEEIKQYINDSIKVVNVFSEPLLDDIEKNRVDFKGILTEEILKEVWPQETPDVYFCGPKGFMVCVLRLLDEMGTKEENIYFEFFGPSEELRLEETLV